MSKPAMSTDVDLSGVDVDTLIKELEERGRYVNGSNGMPKGEDRAAIDDHAKALIVVESRVIGIGAAAAMYGVSKEAIYIWRKRELAEPAFQNLVHQKNSQYREDWSAESANTIRKILSYLGSAAEQGAAEGNIEPAFIRAQAGALKMVGEFKLAVDITYSKLGKNLQQLQLTEGEKDQQYQITAAEGVIEGDFDDLKAMDE